MTNQHPITPPLELVQQWNTEGRHQDYYTLTESIAARAAQWGSDQELEACCEWLKVQETQSAKWFDIRHDACALVSDLRAARRPKPPSLKEQLLQKLEHIRDVADKYQSTQNAIDDLRETLEALDD